MELVDIKNKLLEFESVICDIKETLKIDSKRESLKALEQRTMEDGFWENSKNSGEVLKQIKDLKVELASFDKVNDAYENLQLTYELLKEEYDETLMQDVKREIQILETKVEKLKISSLLSEEYDTLNAIVTIHSI